MHQPKTMWLSLSLCDGEGQYTKGFALELLSVILYGLDGHDMIVDVVHLDLEHERLRFRAVPANVGWTFYFHLGTLPDFVAGVRMTGEFPANLPVSKAEFRARCGTGRLLNALGHFVEQD